MSTNKTLGLLLEHKDPGEYSFGPTHRPYVSGGGTLKKAGGGKRAMAGKDFKSKVRIVGAQTKTVKRNARRMELRKNGGGKK